MVKDRLLNYRYVQVLNHKCRLRYCKSTIINSCVSSFFFSTLQFSNIRGSNKPNRKESSAKQPRIPQSKQNVAEESAEAQAEYERSLEASLTDNEVLAAFERMLVSSWFKSLQSSVLQGHTPCFQVEYPPPPQPNKTNIITEINYNATVGAEGN